MWCSLCAGSSPGSVGGCSDLMGSLTSDPCLTPPQPVPSAGSCFSGLPAKHPKRTLCLPYPLPGEKGKEGLSAQRRAAVWAAHKPSPLRPWAAGEFRE